MARLLFAVAALSLLLLAGCSGDPVEQANEYITEANEAIDEHNQLYEEARTTYEEARTAVEDGGDPSEEVERVTETRETLEEARATLSGARTPLAEVRDLDVDPEIAQYAALLSGAIEAQIAAEDQEMEFYQILEEDPSLEDNREEAESLLAEADDGYQQAEDAYGRAQELADANPSVIGEG
jgi:DNA repair exonuclease SbcCD ATPase subunit